MAVDERPRLMMRSLYTTDSVGLSNLSLSDSATLPHESEFSKARIQ